MKFALDKQDHYVILTPQEERLNTLNAPALKSELILLHNNGYKNILLDLQYVQMIDSSGLSAFLMAKRLCDGTGGVFTLCALNPHVRKLIEIAQLDKVINLLPSVQEAIEDVHMHELQAELSSQNGHEAAPDIRPEQRRLRPDDPGVASV
jgi:anti-anti-sigma factor